MADALSTTAIDEDRVRVTTWTFPIIGDATGFHRHQYDYVIVPVSGGTLTVYEQDGTTHTLTQQPGMPYVGASGTAHNVVNESASPITFVEIELKQEPLRSAP